MADYNGWVNYETWVVALAMGNTRDVETAWRNLARMCQLEAASLAPHAVWTVEEHALFLLEDRIKRHHQDEKGELESPYAELLNSALDRVNWKEIAKHYLEE